MQAKFQVFGDYTYTTFLVQNNTGPQYDSGLNTPYTNPSGTALWRIFNGRVRPVLRRNFPGPNQAGGE